jgi:hypothetical protein
VISDRQILAKQRAQAAGNPVYWQVRQTKADGRECLQRVVSGPPSESVGESIRVRRYAPGKRLFGEVRIGRTLFSRARGEPVVLGRVGASVLGEG